MEATLSMTMIAKVVALIPIALFVAMLTLWPINDQPVSRTQKTIFAVVMLVIAALMFGHLSINFTR
jgi:hypothetical protein